MGISFSCMICLTERLFWKRFKNKNKTGCKHPFCKDCIAKYILTKLGDDSADIECPEPGCKARLDPTSCASLISKPVYARWHDLIRQFNEDLDKAKESKTINPDMDVNFALLVASSDIQRCPKCKFFVERTSGCRYIRCRCGTQFCYKCGGLSRNHGHSNLGLCVRKDKILLKK